MGDLSDVIDDLDVKPNMGFELLPAGRYTATVIAAELKDTSTGGKMLVVTEQIWDEAYAGRQLIARFNVVNASEKAQQIGRGQLAALAHACGLGAGIPANSQDLLEKMHIIRVTVEPGSGTNPATGEPYGPKNEVKGWYSMAPKEAKPVPGKPKLPKSLENDALPDFLQG